MSRPDSSEYLVLRQTIAQRGALRPILVLAGLGIWGALRTVARDAQPAPAELRCWNHKIMNVIDQLPKKHWPEAQALLRAMPSLVGRHGRLAQIPGAPPSLIGLPVGCPFAPRCAHATAECAANYPSLREFRPDHFVACWHAERLLGEQA